MSVSIICALAENGAIGYNNGLLFHLCADLQRFKALTLGHTVIMGRKTFESLPYGALPNRRNIVLSGSMIEAPNIEVFSSLHEALKTCVEDEEVFVIGGSSVYDEAFSLADRLYLTHVHTSPKLVDAYFPKLNKKDWFVVKEEQHVQDEQNDVSFTFVDYIRR